MALAGFVHPWLHVVEVVFVGPVGPFVTPLGAEMVQWAPQEAGLLFVASLHLGLQTVLRRNLSHLEALVVEAARLRMTLALEVEVVLVLEVALPGPLGALEMKASQYQKCPMP